MQTTTPINNNEVRTAWIQYYLALANKHVDTCDQCGKCAQTSTYQKSAVNKLELCDSCTKGAK